MAKTIHTMPFQPISPMMSDLLSGSARPHNRIQTSGHSQMKMISIMVKAMVDDHDVTGALARSCFRPRGRLLSPFQPIPSVLSYFRVAFAPMTTRRPPDTRKRKRKENGGGHGRRMRSYGSSRSLFRLRREAAFRLHFSPYFP